MKLKHTTYIFFLSIIPFLLGTVTFYSWFFNRTLQAINIDIERIALLAIISFLIISPITFTWSLVLIIRKRVSWSNLLTPIFVGLLTVFSIIQYGEIHDSYEKRVFLKIIMDRNDLTVNRIWSSNFESNPLNNDNKFFIYSYNPVRNYNWKDSIFNGSSSYIYDYEYSKLYIDLKDKAESIKSFALPEFHEGDCSTIRLSQLTELKK